MKKETLNFPDGSVYEGELVLGQPNGKGIYNFANGKVYDGYWLHGLPNGEGWMLLENLQEFTGHFVNGLREGEGKVYNNEGQELFSGKWVSDSFEGKVSTLDAHVKAYIQKNGEIKNKEAYLEEHAKNVLQSYATASVKKKEEEKNIIRYKTAVYYGGILNGLCHGFGMMIWDIGDIYIGQFSNNMRHGEGRYTFKDGSIYEGQWANNKKNGKGTYYNAVTEETTNEEWFAGEMVKKPEKSITSFQEKISEQNNITYGTKEYTNGYYVGYFKNGLRHGKGQYYWNDGDWYDGDWREGNKEGYGVLYVGITRYEGGFSNNEKHGKGVEYNTRNYKAYDQEWNNGTLVKEEFNYDLSLD